MHPTPILCLWFFAVLLTQRLPSLWLGLLLALCVLGMSAGIRQHWFGLLSRSRWILLILALTFLLMTPGERFGFLPGFISATWEGLEQSLAHLLRLVSVLFAVAWLVGGRAQAELLAGFWGVAHLLRSETVKRAVLRLALTLRYVAETPTGSKSSNGWKVVLDDLHTELGDGARESCAGLDGAATVTHLQVDLTPPPVVQLGVVAVAGVCTVWLWWRLP